MGNAEQRENRRYNVVIRAIVSDLEQKKRVHCMILEGSISGCKILTRQISDLPDAVLLKIPDLNQTIKSRIVWRNQDTAGITFDWKTNSPDERRNAPRQEVTIPAVITDRDLNNIADCIIIDASRTGCQISRETLPKLPKDIHIQIPGLTEPILAQIAWQKGDKAGLEFFWKSDVHILDDLPET